MSLNNEDEKRVTEDASKLTDGAKKISGERRVISLMARNPGLINIMEMFLWFYVSFLTFMIYKSPGIDTVPSETSAFSMFLNMSAGVKALVLGLIPLAFTMVYRISPIQMILRRALSINDEVRITSVALGVVNDEPQKS
ncbi:hypothetical protein ACYKFI_004551, partial [Enterobacter hormaechei]